MITNVRDLAEWYPFLPYTAYEHVSGTAFLEMSNIARHVLDLKVNVALPNLDLSDYCPVAHVIEINDETAEIRINDDISISVPLFIGRDSHPETESYMILDEALQRTVSFPFVVHPACLSITQKPSIIKFYDRKSGNTDSGETCVNQEPVDTDELGFVDGNNVRVDIINGTLVVDAGPGYGLGVYTEPPYSNVSTYNTEHSIGLRSVQGSLEPAITASGLGISVLTEQRGQTDVEISINVQENS